MIRKNETLIQVILALGILAALVFLIIQNRNEEAVNKIQQAEDAQEELMRQDAEEHSEEFLKQYESGETVLPVYE